VKGAETSRGKGDIQTKESDTPTARDPKANGNRMRACRLRNRRCSRPASLTPLASRTAAATAAELKDAWNIILDGSLRGLVREMDLRTKSGVAMYLRIPSSIAAMGTPPVKILALFVAEGFCLGLLGTATGIVLGVAGLLGIKASHVTFSFGRMDNLLLRPDINLTELAIIAAMVLAASALAALQPAWKASRMEPVDALGHV